MTVSLTVPATATAAALSLRPWQIEDAGALAAAHRDPVLRQWLLSPLEDEADARQWIQSQDGFADTGERFNFAIVECGLEGEEVGAPVGNLVLKMTSEFLAGAAEVGYWTASPARGRGIASRALEAVSVWALDRGTMSVERLELLHAVDNQASCRVAAKCGYRLDRVLAPLPPDFPTDGHLHIREP